MVPPATGNQPISCQLRPVKLSNFSVRLHLDLGPDAFVYIIDANLGEELKKANLKGNGGFSCDNLGNDNRCSAGDESPGQTLGQTSKMRVLAWR